MSLNAIECHDIEEHTKALADYMPGGKLWAAKNIANSNLRNFIKGVSGESVRAETFLKVLFSLPIQPRRVEEIGTSYSVARRSPKRA